jgi:L-arabinose isomerase
MRTGPKFHYEADLGKIVVGAHYSAHQSTRRIGAWMLSKAADNNVSLKKLCRCFVRNRREMSWLIFSSFVPSATREKVGMSSNIAASF